MTPLNGFEGLKRLFENTLSRNKSRFFAVAPRQLNLGDFIYGNYICILVQQSFAHVFEISCTVKERERERQIKLTFRSAGLNETWVRRTVNYRVND